MKLKFKVGERIKVKKDIYVGEKYYMRGNSITKTFTEHMAHMRGQEATVIDAREDGYLLDMLGLPLRFTDDMLNKYTDVRAKSNEIHRKYQEEVDGVVFEMLKLYPQQLLDYALATKDKELFEVAVNMKK